MTQLLTPSTLITLKLARGRVEPNFNLINRPLFDIEYDPVSDTLCMITLKCVR